MSIKYIDKDEKYTGIATKLVSICLTFLSFRQISSLR